MRFDRKRFFFAKAAFAFGFVVIFQLYRAYYSDSSAIPDSGMYRPEFSISLQIITAAEAYYAEHGRSPAEDEMQKVLLDQGLKLTEQCPCYRREGEREFVVWFGYATVGTSMVYHSETGKWGPEG